MKRYVGIEVAQEQCALCIDARGAHKVLSARMNKSDKSDAVGLAQLARTRWYGAVNIKSEASDQLRLLLAARVLAARERLIRIRMDIEGQVRGLLQAYGIRHCPLQSRQRTPKDVLKLPWESFSEILPRLTGGVAATSNRHRRQWQMFCAHGCVAKGRRRRRNFIGVS
jgi:transposase